MPRKRKYDYNKDYPVTIYVKVPIWIVKAYENKGYTTYEMQKLLEKNEVVDTFLKKYLEE